MIVTVVLLQVDPVVAESLSRIATMQTILAVVAVLAVVATLAVAVFALRIAIQLRRTVAGVEGKVKGLLERAEPILESGRRIAEDASHATTSVRDQVVVAAHSLKRLNTTLREATADLELRARSFGAVLDVVQEEAEELLLDTAATAHGVRTITERIRSPREAVPVQRPSGDDHRSKDETEPEPARSAANGQG